MRSLLSLTASFLAFHATQAFPGGGPEPDKAIEHFEKGFHDTINYRHNNSIRLIGYKKMKIPETERSQFTQKPDTDIDDDDDSNLHHAYFDASSSTLRIYFPVEGALVNHDGGTIEANDLGELNVNKLQGNFSVLGRKQTDHVTGVDANIIQDGIIYLNPPVVPQHSYDDKIYVYDFGIKAGPGHHHQKEHKKRAWWNPFDWVGGGEEGDDSGEEHGTVDCYKNHGKKTCTTRFGIRHGRCKYKKGVCMDYNKKGSDCENERRNFIGSDCYTAMSRGHCWNEVM